MVFRFACVPLFAIVAIAIWESGGSHSASIEAQAATTDESGPECRVSHAPHSDATILCTLDPNKVVIESAGGRTVVSRADAVLFERPFDGGTVSPKGSPEELFARDRALLIISGVPATSISISSSHGSPTLTVRLDEPADATLRALRRTMDDLSTHGGFVNAVFGFGVPYLQDCTALNDLAVQEANGDSTNVAASLADALNARLIGHGDRLTLSNGDPASSEAVRCGNGVLRAPEFDDSDVIDRLELASSHSVDTFFVASAARPPYLIRSGRTLQDIVRVVPDGTQSNILKARFIASPSFPHVFAIGTSLREYAIGDEISMPAMALRLALWKAEVAASAAGFSTGVVDGAIAYDTRRPYSNPSLDYETEAARSIGAFVTLRRVAAPVDPPDSSTYEKIDPQRPMRETIIGGCAAGDCMRGNLPFAWSDDDETSSATIVVRQPSETATLIFAFHRDGKVFSDEERTAIARELEGEAGTGFIPFHGPAILPDGPFDLTVGGWFQNLTKDRADRLVASARHFAAVANAEPSALFRSVVYDCGPLEKRAIEAATSEALQGASVAEKRPFDTLRIRTIGLLGPNLRNGECGSNALAFPPDSDPKRFIQSLDEVGDPTIVMRVSAVITFSRQ